MTAKMRVAMGLVALGLVASPALAATMNYKNVSVVDVGCSNKLAAGDPDKHTRQCALDCEDSGYAIVTADKKVVKFDAAGNAKIAAALKASKATDHLRVDVSGDQNGDVLKVASVKLL